MKFFNHKVWISIYLAAMYGALGVHSNYMQIYLQDHGFTYEQIGLFMALIPALAMWFTPIWGMLADSSQDPRRLLWLLMLLTPLTHLPLVAGGSLMSCIAVCVCVALFYQPTLPLQDSLTLRALHLYGGDYGKLRIWGSIGFTIPSMIFSLFWAQSGDGKVDWTIPGVVFFGYSFLALLTLIFFPATPPDKKNRFNLKCFKLLKNRSYGILLACLFLTKIGASAMEGYQIVYFREMGVPIGQLGLFLVLGPLSEVVTIFYSQLWMLRFGARRMMALCLGAMALRLAVTAFSDHWPTLVTIQLLHCLTFGTQHVVTILVVNQLAGDQIRASAQTLTNVFSNYLPRVIGLLFAGWFVSKAGFPALFGFGAGVAALAFILWLCFFFDSEDTALKDGIR